MSSFPGSSSAGNTMEEPGPSCPKALFRFLLLFFNCLMSFGNYFCLDIPSVLQDQFQGKLTCPNATTINGTKGCVLGLGMTPHMYNLLFSMNSCANAAVMAISGFLVDKLGNLFGVFLFNFLCILGSSLFALGSHFKGTPYLLPLMLTGRLVFGAGSGSLIVLQDRITAVWFRQNGLALAFGLTLGFSRAGSVLNFFATKRFEEKYGMQWTLWSGTLLCVLCFVVGCIVSFLDKMGLRQMGLERVVQEESDKVTIRDLKLLPLTFWFLTLSITFFYIGIFPFIADASKFIQDKYSGYSQTEAAYITGAVYTVALVFMAVAGVIIDYVGLRGIFSLSSAILTLPVFVLLAFTYVPPLVSTIWLGITYSFAAVSMWPSIALVVPQATLGMAIGLTTSIYMAWNGLSSLIVGWILGTKTSEIKIPLWRWQKMMVFLLANTICCIITSMVLNIVDHRQGGMLNKKSKWSEQAEKTLDMEFLNQVEDKKNDKATSNKI